MSPAVRPGHHETTLDEARQLARVDEDGHVYATAPTSSGTPEPAVRQEESAEQTPAEQTGQPQEPEGDQSAGRPSAGEVYVGQYPGATSEEALQYFTRKFDELFNRALLLKARVEAAADGAKALRESREALLAELDGGAWVGDVPALRSMLAELAEGIDALAAREKEEAEQAVAEHLTVREGIVAEAEQIAATDPGAQHWKSAQQRMSELFEAWKAEQKKPPRLTKAQEDPYWKRFRAARNTFDKERRAFFSRRDKEHGEVKRIKEELIARAEELQHSTDFGPTTKAYHRLMDEWKAAGRGARRTDDAQWARFRKAQDVFFASRDAVNAEIDAEYQANLEVKEQLLKELEALMPFTAPETVRDRYHALLERWDAAGRVPRGDVKRMEGALKRVQDAFREAEEAHWRRTDPETVARQNSMLTQLDETIAGLEQELEQARSAGDARTMLRRRRLWRRGAAGGG
ncbi:DUF349 domain-containing protein [Nesterenkonia sp. PF2B19]|uniref:DUF349 domain-containing protein n=1 Tax=Nesterenkonia sp. PF2B19 TaxID=1881858 RepID=UPI0008720E71|nr:DUF349 domain-containing protein [Nesterenkonia sp. PF2B19]